jgi:lactate dehydrogenase-like 2-hydroxyacid dehydrogenase
MIAVLLETIHEAALSLLQENGFDIIEAYNDHTIPTSFDKTKIDVIITRGKGQVRASAIDQCSNLKAIARCGIGLENIDVDYAKSRGIAILNAPGSNTQTTAEHAFALMINLVRGLYQPILATKNFDFQYRNIYNGDELYGKEVGIIGMGNIGKQFAAMANAFGCKVSYHSRSKKEVPYTYKEKYDLLAESDIISIHAPMTSETIGLVNKDFLTHMKQGSYLINTARTEMINIDEVLLALDQGKLNGYTSDCPMRDDSNSWRKLVAHPRSLISPHIASLTATTYKEMCLITIKKVLELRL